MVRSQPIKIGINCRTAGGGGGGGGGGLKLGDRPACQGMLGLFFLEGVVLDVVVNVL